jgi:hypothetical protein
VQGVAFEFEHVTMTWTMFPFISDAARSKYPIPVVPFWTTEFTEALTVPKLVATVAVTTVHVPVIRVPVVDRNSIGIG